MSGSRVRRRLGPGLALSLVLAVIAGGGCEEAPRHRSLRRRPPAQQQAPVPETPAPPAAREAPVKPPATPMPPTSAPTVASTPASPTAAKPGAVAPAPPAAADPRADTKGEIKFDDRGPVPDRAVRVDRFHPAGAAGANRCVGIKARTAGTFVVSGVDASDVLNVREQPDWKSEVLGKLPYDMTGIVGTSERQRVGGSTWRKIACGSVRGWVNERFLVPEPGGS